MGKRKEVSLEEAECKVSNTAEAGMYAFALTYGKEKKGEVKQKTLHLLAAEELEREMWLKALSMQRESC